MKRKASDGEVGGGSSPTALPAKTEDGQGLEYDCAPSDRGAAVATVQQGKIEDHTTTGTQAATSSPAAAVVGGLQQEVSCSVETFILRHGLDERVSEKLRALTPVQQQAIVGQSMGDVRNASAVVWQRVRAAQHSGVSPATDPRRNKPFGGAYLQQSTQPVHHASPSVPAHAAPPTYHPAPQGGRAPPPTQYEQGGHASTPYGQGGHASTPYGQGGHASNPYGQGGHASNPYGQGGHAPTLYGQGGYAPPPTQHFGPPAHLRSCSHEPQMQPAHEPRGFHYGAPPRDGPMQHQHSHGARDPSYGAAPPPPSWLQAPPAPQHRGQILHVTVRATEAFTSSYAAPPPLLHPPPIPYFRGRAPHFGKPSFDAGAPWQIDAEHFVALHGLDDRCASKLRELPEERRQAVMARDLRGAKNPSAVIWRRVRAAQHGDPIPE